MIFSLCIAFIMITILLLCFKFVKRIGWKIAGILTLVMLLTVSCGNYDYYDSVRTFDYAYILLPNGECIEGKVDSWRDYEDGDQLQIEINGVIYLTDTTRAVLVNR